MNMEIITINSRYENGKCAGGYHEIHKVQFLSGSKHAIATIESVIKNNLLYGCDITILERVIVSFSDKKTVIKVKEHFRDYPIKVEVEYDR